MASTGATFTAAQAAQVHDLCSLISSAHSGSSGEAVVFPTEDTITALLHARARAELPYIRVSPSGTDYIVVNPLRVLQCLNEASRKGYEDDIEQTDGGNGGPDQRQPSVYELAGRAWLLMSRRSECQTIVYQ